MQRFGPRVRARPGARSVWWPTRWNQPLSPEEKAASRVCIVDNSGLLLADSGKEILSRTIEIKQRSQLFAETKGFVVETVGGNNCLVAHAQSPGFETYKTGWHALIIQRTS